MKHIDLTPFMGRDMSDADWQHLMMKILFTPRENKRSYADALIRKAELQPGLNAEQPDLLLRLLGFEKSTMPKMSTVFNSEMGYLFETILKVLFKLSNSALFHDDFSELEKRLPKNHQDTFKKSKSDLVFDADAIEVKYRYGSHEGLPKQMETFRPLKIMGLEPVTVSLRRSPNTQELRRSGWRVFEGESAYAYIRDKTGYDLEHILLVASANPLIKKRITTLQERYQGCIQARLASDFENALNRHRAPVHRLIAQDDAARSEFLSDIGFADQILGGFLDHIIKTGPSVLKDPAIRTLVDEVNNNSRTNMASQTEMMAG